MPEHTTIRVSKKLSDDLHIVALKKAVNIVDNNLIRSFMLRIVGGNI